MVPTCEDFANLYLFYVIFFSYLLREFTWYVKIIYFIPTYIYFLTQPQFKIMKQIWIIRVLAVNRYTNCQSPYCLHVFTSRFSCMHSIEYVSNTYQLCIWDCDYCLTLNFLQPSCTDSNSLLQKSRSKGSMRQASHIIVNHGTQNSSPYCCKNLSTNIL